MHARSDSSCKERIDAMRSRYSFQIVFQGFNAYGIGDCSPGMQQNITFVHSITPLTVCPFSPCLSTTAS